ncbi:hypothetical protein [Streptococcus parasanguinis]|uniref:Antitoxin n=1 Tax=Streptococcus parasanguinis TaxID=1318 RepID=A0AAE8ADM7_STRPA|nr:hypothetical protein DWZ19_06520 [Streptococcus parasanguinis]
MMKRTYSIFVFGNEQTDQMLILKFTDPKFQSLSNFLNSEVHNFYSDVREALENVISGNMEEYAFDGNLLGIEVGKEITEVYFQFEEELLGEPCFISTDELYNLVIEWKEMEDKMYRGEDIFPVTIED